MRAFGAVALLAVSALVFMGCPKKGRERPKDQSVVRMFAKTATSSAPIAVITVAEYRQELARARLEREEDLRAALLPADLKVALLGMMIERRLLLAEAERLQVHVSTAAVAREVGAMKAALSESELAKRLIDTYQTESDLRRAVERRLVVKQLVSSARKGVEVSEEEIIEAWENMPASEKVMPARVHASQIVVPTEEEGKEIVKQLKRGESFEDLARVKSTGPEATRGGDLGWFEKGVMPSIFDEICFSLKPGQVSHLNPSEYGFHIFRVHAVEAEKPLTLAEARDRIHAKILREKLEEAEREFVRALQRRVRIEKDEQVLATIE